MRPITRRTTAYKLPTACAFCLGDVYHGSAGTACIACGKRPADPDAANKTQAVEEGYSHSFPPRFEEEQ
jgi:hypothetical protein